MTDFKSIFQSFAKENNFHPDSAQEAVVQKLNKLFLYFSDKPSKSWFSKSKPPKGVYLWGGVGRGKTMMMDLFFDRVPIHQKRRVHFNIFMLDVHNSVKILREGGKGKDPLLPIAKDIAANTRLLCFDEFQVYDIADAMVLSELFKALFACGVVVVATSNVAPDDLYKDGLQRARFLPFIPLVKKAMEVVHLDSKTDYRQQALRDNGTYFINREADMRRLFHKLGNGKTGTPETIKVQSRSIPVTMATEGIAWTDFTELCEKPRAAADYQALCEVYHTVFVNHVPRMGYDRRNEAKRFILLIDTLYDAGVRVVINAEVTPQDLYHGTHHAFEFERTISRLLEMQGESYLLRTSKDKIDSL